MRWLFYVLIIFLILLLYMVYSQQIKETMIANLSSSQTVATLDDMRTFLEELYTVTYTNPNSVVSGNIKNTICYQISILGTYIPTVLSSIPRATMEELFKTYGSPPRQAIGASATPPAPGILTSTQDYVMLLQLYMAGSNLSMVTVEDDPIWHQDLSGDTTVTVDLCESIDKSNSDIIAYSVSLYNIIKTCLQHFHNQVANSSSNTYGDISDTVTYSEGMADYYSPYITKQCSLGTISGNNICKGQPQPSDFYTSYATTTYTDFKTAGTFSLKSFVPSKDITKFRVLLIGAGGGGGGAASGKNNNKGHDQQGGGGGGGGGGGITSSSPYPYTNNYQIIVGSKGAGGAKAYGSNRGTPGFLGGKGNSSNLYDSANRETVLTADGGSGGGGGKVASANSGASGYEHTGTQGDGGAGGSGITSSGNAGEGAQTLTRTGGNGGSSVEWSTLSETTVESLHGGSGGNCPEVGRNKGSNTMGNGGSSGNDGFVRVYWIP
jgi:hypothetical protein